MTDLPQQWQTPNVPANAQRPDMEWLTARVMSFLGHYFQPNESEVEFRMRMADWREDLADLPREAIEKAMVARRRSTDRTRPTPGEIRSLAQSYILRAEQPTSEHHFGPTVEKDQITPERARALVRESDGAIVLNLVKAWEARKEQDGAA